MASYASSMIKSTAKMTKSTAKYLASYVKKSDNTKNTKPELSWVSCILFFKTPFKTYHVDQALILVGDVPTNYHGFFTNLMNWTIIDGKLFYTGEIRNHTNKSYVTMIEIDPRQVYIHFKVGDTPYNIDFFNDDPNYYEIFFTSPTSKTYKLIRDILNETNVKVIDLSKELGPITDLPLKDRAYKIHDPRFHTYKYTVYGNSMEHAIFVGLDLSRVGS